MKKLSKKKTLEFIGPDLFDYIGPETDSSRIAELEMMWKSAAQAEGLELHKDLIFLLMDFRADLQAELQEPRSPGRPVDVGGKQIMVYLDADSVKIAKVLGRGNVSQGIRLALQTCKKP